MNEPNSLPRRTINFFGNLKLALGSVLLAGLALAVGALVFFAWLTDEMLEGATRNFDESIRSAVHAFAAPALTSVMMAASFLGSTLFLIGFGIVVFIIFFLLKRRRAAIVFALTMLGSTVLLVTLKTVFHRTRPDPFFDTVLPVSYSFPSGHALSSFCFYGALAAIITNRINNRLIQILIWIFAALLVALIGLSRIYLGVHYPSDVLAGYTVALIWVVTVAIGDRLLRAKKGNAETIES